ncbi:MAG: hypothetical protein COV55_01750 [Candidatus Komeilibacteria bacterium CG11_big_fil_rev_8_21_14_0_20_36_20]|uniref:tetrahydrofolate synthase n=1 Tax=Candidatus Komeilibacteria bacterium CG11_big_fil_rev_8_21_14_0_20_36_20 TaxID=1974477 RepID=A0A2H0NG50_9BACT|nr:MAG: hypothetical protein COV55_01750 [Candidatus Komeilibacteria bacterium CG11_big_fil_rev_8_21_14_0_20_36_20]PIR81267.1 MAG: hypothetical protein COU21_04735 [Candidatus Komeilibacteria bacterium CG10_big_fil_rev_8_21_14_0_10_36_65]PJC55231.1 MAG: hypothetical protein CO027_03675 [Candidatus Komeilibacteria bacterium CG_4_9_14_0_2_um_filter_36_13]
MKTYQKDIAFLESLANLPQKNYLLGLKDRSIFLIRLKNFLTLVGNPQNKLKFIHIAGTSGKGSTVGILRELMANARLKVGSYTSPFATTSLEKIQINQNLISPKDLHQILEQKIKPALNKYILKFPTEPISYFEAWLAIGLLYYQQAECNWVILETGLGGTHDATNVITHPKITAITNIGLDHTHILGHTKKKIAQDKAGIIKKGSRFLTTEKSPKLISIFKSVTKKKKAKFIVLKNLTRQYDGGTYFSTPRQKNNLNLALNVLDVLKIKPRQVQKIINNFQLICRQEIIQKNPLVILDGAHNPDKLSNLVNFIKQQKYKKLHLIIGLAENKDCRQALKKILPLADYLYLTRFLVIQRKTAALRKLYQQSRRISKIPCQLFLDPHQALEAAFAQARQSDLILITGSFFLTGELRKYWITEEYIIKNLKTFK